MDTFLNENFKTKSEKKMNKNTNFKLKSENQIVKVSKSELKSLIVEEKK